MYVSYILLWDYNWGRYRAFLQISTGPQIQPCSASECDWIVPGTIDAQ